MKNPAHKKLTTTTANVATAMETGRWAAIVCTSQYTTAPDNASSATSATYPDATSRLISRITRTTPPEIAI